MPIPGDTYYATLFQPGADEAPVTGLAADLAVRRIGSSTVWYNWITGAWDSGLTEATLGAEHRTSLTDNGDGSYTKAFNQATIDASANQTYLFVYRVTTVGYESRTVEQVEFRTFTVSAIVAANATNTTARDEDALEIIKGDPAILSFTCTDSSGVAANITGHTLYFTVRVTRNATGTTDTDATFQKTAAIVNGAAGTCTVTIPTTDTGDLDIGTTYYWDLCDITGGHVTYARGTLRGLWHTTLRTS